MSGHGNQEFTSAKGADGMSEARRLGRRSGRGMQIFYLVAAIVVVAVVVAAVLLGD